MIQEPIVEYATDLSDLLARAAIRFGDHVALDPGTDGSSGQRHVSRITYASLNSRAVTAAARLREAGLVPGDRVALCAPGSPDWVVAFFGAVAAGLVPLLVSPRLTEANVAGLVNIAKPKAAIVPSARGASGPGDPPTNEATCALTSSMRYLLVEDLAAPATPIETPLRGIAAHDADSAAVLVFTSGTTGTPRAVELTHRNLLSNVRSLLAVRRVTPSDSMLAMLSPSEPFALTAGLLAPLSCGARVVFTIPLPPNRLLELCRREEITHTLLVPALVELLVREVLDDLHASPSSAPAPAAPERTTSALRERLGPQFRHLAVGGAALDPALAALLAGSGFEVDVGYGLAEASPIVAVGSLATTPRGSVGRPLPGVTVAVSEAGEILVRGPNVMPRYVDDSEATAVALRDGWLHTGDSGVVDPDGFVFVLGRIKEIMVTPSGQTIHPEEVEPFYASTLFAEHCVAGIPDASGNDIPTLFLVPTDRETCVQALSREVRSLRASAPPRARIEGWVLVDRALPRTALGKIRRRQLAAQWCDERREVA